VAEQHRDGAELVRRVLGQEHLLHPQFVRRILDRVGEAAGGRIEEEHMSVSEQVDALQKAGSESEEFR
jgi:hypothetical protein